MTLLLAYGDIQDALDRALTAERGISLQLGTYGRAVHFRQKIYRLRKKLREDSKAIYQPTDFMYNRTPYDSLAIPNPEKGSGELRIVKTELTNFEVKEL